MPSLFYALSPDIRRKPTQRARILPAATKRHTRYKKV